MKECQRSFDEEVSFFLNACPGPAVVKHGLRLVAFQEVRGIRGLESAEEGDELQTSTEYGRGSGHRGVDRRYLHRVAEIAKRVGCRPAYLSEAALRHGFHYSRAVRWILFLHGMALRAEGVGALTLAMRLGFSDLAGWSRFTTRLTGRTPNQLPNLPLEMWARRAVDDVFLSPGTPREAEASH